MHFFSIFLFFFLIQLHAAGQDVIFTTTSGTISFISDAPLEVISAASKKMEGVMDTRALSYAFSVNIRTFEGFNNGLQRQHFYENYMETDKYPKATFSGKIIEHVDLTKPGTYQVRAKGMLTIHGRSKERILKTELICNGTEIKASSSFRVPLTDHQIEVPRIVYQKIAQEIEVKVKATLILPAKS